VQVVDGVAPVILNVPAESREHHADIKPRHLHPRDVSINVAQERLLQHGHHIQVPAAAGVFLPRQREPCALRISTGLGLWKDFEITSKQEVSELHEYLCESIVKSLRTLFIRTANKRRFNQLLSMLSMS